MPAAAGRRRVRLRVEGVVQGVRVPPVRAPPGARARARRLRANDAGGVVIEVEGTPGGVARFLAQLPVEAPPLATVERIACEERVPCGGAGFVIAASAVAGPAVDPAAGPATALVAPDAATCADCLANSSIRAIAASATLSSTARTAARALPWCAACPVRPPAHHDGRLSMCGPARREYDDPADRRFHAQPNACAACGPRCGWWTPRGASRSAATVAPAATRRPGGGALRGGAVVAVKGIGGFHLACRADRRGGRRPAPAPQAPRGQTLRADGRDLADARRLCYSTSRRRACSPPASGRSCWPSSRRRPGRGGRGAGAARPRRACSPTRRSTTSCSGRRCAPGDDERQPLRRADRLPRRRGAHPPGWHRRSLPDARPPHPPARRRLGGRASSAGGAGR